MTQLVELQRMTPILDVEGVALFSISYDTTAVLADFAEREGITFPMLSDVGSKVISALGLRNDRVHEQHAVFGFKPNPRNEGVPYPGVFALAEDGTITERRFFDLYRERETGPGLIERILGIDSGLDGPQLTSKAGRTSVTVRLDSADYKSNQRVWLYADIALDENSHVLAAGNPETYVPLAVEIDAVDGVFAGDPEWPEPTPFRLEGESSDLLVHEGRVRGTVPLRFHSASGAGDITITGRVRLQICTATMCDLPGSVEFTLPISAGRLVVPAPKT